MRTSLRVCSLLTLAGSAGIFLGTPNPAVHLPLIMLFYPAALYLAARTGAPFRTGWIVGIPGAAAAL